MERPIRRLVPIMARRRTVFRAAPIVMAVWWVIVMARGVWMPLPEGLSTSGPERGVARLERSIGSRKFSGLSSF